LPYSAVLICPTFWQVGALFQALKKLTGEDDSDVVEGEEVKTSFGFALLPFLAVTCCVAVSMERRWLSLLIVFAWLCQYY
jgi:hypothetical protein